MSKTGKLAIVAGTILLLGYIAYTSMSGVQISCEVCIEFHGRTDCRTASGQDEDEATISATNTACSMLAGGVADSIACSNTQPKSASCKQR